MHIGRFQLFTDPRAPLRGWRAGAPRALRLGSWALVFALCAGVGVVRADDAARAWGHPFWGGLGSNGTVCVTCHQSDPYATLSGASPVLASQWWVAGGTRRLPSYAWFKNAAGAGGLLNAAGVLETGGHPFFKPLGANGRACVSCHQPADGMSLSQRTIQSRWTTTAGHDPLFAMIDGANCPGLVPEAASSHTLLLEKGLFRVALPWPPRAADGTAVVPEFQLEVVADPTGCNLDPIHGLQAADPQVSVFRRPRLAANLAYLEPAEGYAATVLMSDGRAPTLTAQMDDAAVHHLQTHGGLDAADQAAVRAFERQVYVAQAWHTDGGSLNEAGSGLGAAMLVAEAAHSAGVASATPFPELNGWLTEESFREGVGARPVSLVTLPAQRPNAATESVAVRAYRDAVARGYALFLSRPFVGDDGQPETCATCHNGLHTGVDVRGLHPGLGVAALVGGLPAPDLPLFRATCTDAAPTARSGRVLYTHDPGRALVTGRCVDLGEVYTQQLRALSARPPYFTGGSAPTLRAVVEYYDRRFAIGYSGQEVDDLVRFLEAL